MPLGMEVGHCPGDFVLDGDPAPCPKRGRSPPNFRPKRLDGSRWHLDHKSYHVCVSSTFLLPLTPSTTASYSLVSPLGSVCMALSSTGSSPTCHLAPSVSDVITLFRPCVPPRVVFPKAPFLVPCFSSCTLPLSALSSPRFHSITTFMQMTPNCFSHSTHPTSIHALPALPM